MPKTVNQKLKLLQLARIFREETDEDHLLTTQDLIDRLNALDIKAERKSIYSDIQCLKEFGMDIECVQSKTFGYYLASREFELPELKLLVDAVQSSRFITESKSQKLIKKLAKLTSKPQAAELDHQVFITDRPKAINEKIYYSVDAINQAIVQKKQIAFQYFYYNIAKEEVLRQEGKIYHATPLAMCWSDDNYYVICYHDKYDDVAHYRVDRMKRVKVENTPGHSPKSSQFDVVDHVKQTFGMFSGESVRAELRFTKDLINPVLDRFGHEIQLIDEGDHFRIAVEVSLNPVFLSWLFVFGNKVEILAPDCLRQAMLKQLKDIQAVYEKS